MLSFDIIALLEIKCGYVFSVAGFSVLRSSNRGARGGVAVLVKNRLWSHVFDVQLLNDQVWFKLSLMPDTYIGVCYIPPSDSSYFNSSSFSDLQDQILDSGNRVLIIGDFNSRMPALHRLNDHARGISYARNMDDGENAHGRVLFNMCVNQGIYPANHLTHNNRTFDGNKTFRKREKWISQLDWLLVSPPLLHMLDDFAINQHSPFLSDHAALTVKLKCSPLSLEIILQRSKLLDTYANSAGQRVARKAVQMNSFSAEKFRTELPDASTWWRQLCDSTDTDEPESVDNFCNQLTNVLYDTCWAARHNDQTAHPAQGRTSNDAQSRWQTLLQNKDTKSIWSSINWKGQFEPQNGQKHKPSDECFRRHFEKLLNQDPPGDDLIIPFTDVCIPILDDPISIQEVKNTITKLRRDKASGVDGIPPGVLKLIEAEWLNVITFLFNMIFEGTYPEQWSYAKMFTVFKKGNKEDPNNYRGISVQGALAKVYDGVLNNRFVQWYQPDDEQAGGRTGRGCTEQLLILRLLIDYAKQTKQTLYIAYIDYVKAYDKLNRSILLQKLANHGCGKKYLNALAASIKVTRNALGSEIFTSSSGVKQGAANSCSLFTFYINSTVRAIKSFGNDGFLENLHCLLYMDDTVVLATTREAMQKKLTLLHRESEAIGMEIHPQKSKFMVVSEEDKRPFRVHSISIDYTNEYVYLGTPVMNASLKNQVKAHIGLKQGHLIKFFAFLKKNADAPFPVKELVYKSALSSAMLYGCESWLCNDLKPAASPILSAQKQLLAVRNQTCSDLVKAELGYAETKDMVKEAQLKFLLKLTSRPDYEGSPAHFAINLARRAETPAGKYVNVLMRNTAGSFQNSSQEAIKAKISESESSRRKTYLEFNPNLSCHRIYRENIPEHIRIAFTRVRLGSHRLKIETGRWARIPTDERLCVCGAVQTERHVLLNCPVTEHLQRLYPNLNFNELADLMEGNPSEIASYCYAVLKEFNSM